MKKILFPALLMLVACQHQSMPVITSRNAEKPKRIVAVYAAPGTVEADTATGKALFSGNCGRCHGLPSPGAFRAPRWESVLQMMIPKARLNEVQAVHLRAWVLANAAK